MCIRQRHHPAINLPFLRYPHKTSTLRSNRNISARQNNTLKCAEDVNLWHMENAENQHRFFFTNTLAFTGKEKDSLRLNPQSGDFAGLGSQVHWTYSQDFTTSVPATTTPPCRASSSQSTPCRTSTRASHHTPTARGAL